MNTNLSLPPTSVGSFPDFSQQFAVSKWLIANEEIARQIDDLQSKVHTAIGTRRVRMERTISKLSSDYEANKLHIEALKDNHDENWNKLDVIFASPEPSLEQKPEPSLEQKPEQQPEPSLEQKPEPSLEQKPEQQPEPSLEQKPEPSLEATPEQQPEPSQEQKPEPSLEATPEQQPEPSQQTKELLTALNNANKLALERFERNVQLSEKVNTLENSNALLETQISKIPPGLTARLKYFNDQLENMRKLDILNDQIKTLEQHAGKLKAITLIDDFHDETYFMSIENNASGKHLQTFALKNPFLILEVINYMLLKMESKRYELVTLIES